MHTKSKTKKAFGAQKQSESSSLSSLMRRFKSHEVYASLKPSKPKSQKQSLKQSDGTTITINLNLPQSNLNIDNWSQSNKNPKRVISEKQRDHLVKSKTATSNWKKPKDHSSSSNYALNTGRMLDQIYTMKILNEESIQELDTEENCNTYDDKKDNVNVNANLNEGYLTSYSTSKKHLDNIQPYSNVIKSHPNSNNNNCYYDSYDNPNRKLILAAKKGDKDLVLELIDEIMNRSSGPGLDFRDESGWNAMHYACDEGNLKIVEILLKTNIDINSKTNDKKTPLHFASRHGYFDISKQLIENEALLNALDNEKNTPIHLCTIGNHLELLKFFCDRSKTIDIKNIYGKTPFDLASNDETKLLLKQYSITTPNTNTNTSSNIPNSKTPSQTLKVKIHTTNTKHVNTLIKQINCKGYKTPIRFNNNSSNNFSNENGHSSTSKGGYSATSQKYQNSHNNNIIRPMSSKTKFNNNTVSNNNNIQNNNININISTKLCNVSHQNTKQFSDQQKSHGVAVDESSSSNQKPQGVNAKGENKKKLIKPNKSHNVNKKVHQKSTSEKVDKSSHSQNKKKYGETYSIVTQLFNSNGNSNNSNNNNKTTSQSLNKRNNVYTCTYQTSSLPHKEKSKNNEENISQSTKRLSSKKKKKDEINSFKEPEKDKDKDKEKKLSNKNILEKSVRIANVEISLDQQTSSPVKKVKDPEVKIEEKEVNQNIIIEKPTEKDKEMDENTIINLSMEDENENEHNNNNNEQEQEQDKNEEHENQNDQNEEEDKNDGDIPNEEDIDNSKNENSSADEEKIGPSSFVCLALLGRGSFGEVYLVQKKNSDNLYAMKVLDKDKIMGQNIVKYAMTERNVLSLTSHPFIVKLNFAFQTSEKLFLLLDYCPGGDLAEQLTLETRFTEERAKLYLCEIILALGDLHQKNIIFRDLKPDNVVLDSEGHAMLTDFGLSREGVYDAKIAKSFCGSIAYLAPEMLSRKGHGKAVDWYLLGVLFYEMLVGVPPYFTNNKDQIFKNIQNGDLQIPRFVNPKATKLLRLLLKKNPNERLGSINDVDEIKENEYFKDVDWEKVYNKELKPPLPKSLSHAVLIYKNPKMFTDNTDQMESINNVDQKFDGWSFVQNNKMNNNNNTNYDEMK